MDWVGHWARGHSSVSNHDWSSPRDTINLALLIIDSCTRSHDSPTPRPCASMTYYLEMIIVAGARVNAKQG